MDFQHDLPDFLCELALTQFESEQNIPESGGNITSTMSNPPVNQNTKRFAEPVEIQDIQRMGEETIPENTKKNMNWAVKAFLDWRIERNRLYVARLATNFPLEFLITWKDLEQFSLEEMNLIFPLFISEARKRNGERYPSKSLFQMVVSLQAYLRMKNRPVSLLKDIQFKTIQDTLDFHMKKSAKEALNKTQQADIISPEVEVAMWDDGVLGENNPQQLLHTLMYLLGLNFALRASDHKALNVDEQLSIKTDSKGSIFLEYAETTSKTSQGGIKTRKREQRISRAYANTLQPQRCPVRIFNLYCSKCPTENRPCQLYLQPLTSKDLGSCWYARRPLGIHNIEGFLRKLTLPMGEKGKFTPHSLRATNATRLYRQGVSEQMIQKQTGHSSLAVRRYKRTSDEQKKEISTLLQPNVEKIERKSSFSVIPTSLNYDSSEDFVEIRPQKKSKPSSTISRPFPSTSSMVNPQEDLVRRLPRIPTQNEPSRPDSVNSESNATAARPSVDRMPHNLPNPPLVPTPPGREEMPQNIPNAPQPVLNQAFGLSNLEFNIDTEKKTIQIKINL